MIPNRCNEIVKHWEIAVMGTLVTREFPHPFYGIQIRAIWWQEVQLHDVSVFMQPRLQLPGMVPPRVVHNDQHLSVFSSVAHQLFQEQLKRGRVKGFFAARHKASVLNANRSEQRYTFARRGMK
jgi:hypothetical protein